MKMYLDPQKWAERVKDVPLPLRRKAFSELDAEYERRGFKAGESGRDENGNYIEVSIRPGTTMEELYGFLNSTDTACVSIGPKDIPVLCGKDVLTLGLQRNIETRGPGEMGLELLEPSAVATALQNAQLQTLTAGNGEAPCDLERDCITADLIANGHLDINEEMATDRWIDRTPEEPGEPGGNMGEYAPSPDIAEWEGL